MKMDELNEMSAEAAAENFQKCCGSTRWAQQMAQARPFRSMENLCTSADEIWNRLEAQDWLEAFSHHPRIGARIGASAWSQQEQSSVNHAHQDIQAGLVSWNQKYEEKFGHVFLICATGKSADEMLAALQSRFQNSSQEELMHAMREQSKITRIRLEKLLKEGS